jgi:hypothetical protein
LTSLLLCRVVFPSYRFLAAYKAHVLYAYVREAFRPDLFALFGTRAEELKLPAVALRQALVVISKVVLHTGRDVDQLTSSPARTS